MKFFYLVLAMFLFILSCDKKSEKTPVPVKLSNKTKKSTNPTEITDRVVFETSFGNFTVGLYGVGAPNTVKNFLNHVDGGFYSGIIFHRVIKGFVTQAGGMDEKMVERPKQAPIKLEVHKKLKHQKYRLSMARTSDPDSANTQFFVALGKPSHLDAKFGKKATDKNGNWIPNGYAVFGTVTVGKNVIDKIGKVKTKTFGRFTDVPAEPIIITKAYRVK